MRLICNRTQNDAIWELIALFLTNQIAGNTIDFKMNVINPVILQAQHFVCRNAFEVIVQTRVGGGLSPIFKHREELKIQGEAEYFLTSFEVFCPENNR